MEVELGDRVECKISGFVGIVTAIAQCLTGCDRAEVSAPMKKTGEKGDSYFFDVAALKVIKKQVVKPSHVQEPEEKQGRKVGGPPTRSNL